MFIAVCCLLAGSRAGLLSPRGCAGSRGMLSIGAGLLHVEKLKATPAYVISGILLTGHNGPGRPRNAAAVRPDYRCQALG